jgi:hypothetical protein
VVAPRVRESERQIAYNLHPIVCVTKKGVHEFLAENKNLYSAIQTIVSRVGTEMLEFISLYIRTIDENRKVEDTVLPLNKYQELWNHSSQTS